MTTYSWQLLRAGSLRLDGGAMFGIIPKPLWSKLIEPDEQNRITLQTNCLLLRADDGSRTVLIETGYGDKFPEKDRRIFGMEDRSISDALAEVSVDPASIDAVIITHLHFDHAGGVTQLAGASRPTPTFPNARIIVQHTEWDDARANKSTMGRTYLSENLDPITDKVRLIDGSAEVLPGIHVEPMPGHTWGHQMIRFCDEQGTIAFAGDVMPTAAHVGLAYNMAYDVLPHTNMQTKRDYLARACDEGWRIIPPHEPGDAMLTVHRHLKREGTFVLRPTSR
ncbi:MAG: MBL fold metallo-hydrolase [Phycisphaerales bacterium]|nr:MBL fold metallo-hydrolase [Phycisphaerales bacterium]